ncbi:MAG: hypothetical protein ACP5LN_10565 [Thermoproteota archaeon]
MTKNMQQASTLQESSTLQFTGNWFIDAGILGFVNLMEEVYGWKLEDLEEKIAKEPEKIYYGYFPLGYLFYHSTVRNFYDKIQNIRKNISSLNQKLKKIEKDIENLNNEVIKTNNKKELQKLKLSNEKNKIIKNKRKMISDINNLNKELTNLKKEFSDKVSNISNFSNLDKEKIKNILYNFNLKLPAIARNFYIFNSKEVKNNPYLAYRYLQLLCQKKYNELCDFIKEINPKSKKVKDGLTYEIYPDSTINPFLYSPGEFPNLGYTNPLKTTEIEISLKLNLPIFVSLLCFEHAFENYYEKEVVRNVFFYTNNLDLCYNINKRMRIKKEIALNKSKQQSLLRLTFSSVFDELIEHKTEFSLENMYLIEYSGIEKQKFKDVEYIGIPKLQASILLDDIIREALNESIQFRDKNYEDNKCWLLKEFIKGKSLYSVIFDHVKLVLNKKVSLSYYSSLYSLIVDAKVLEFRESKERTNKSLFSEKYFDNYKALVNEIKKEVRFTFSKVSLIQEISKDNEHKERLARELLSVLEGEDKNMFLNILLKNLNEEKQLCRNDNINNWILEKITLNNISWKNYALILVMTLLPFRRD